MTQNSIQPPLRQRAFPRHAGLAAMLVGAAFAASAHHGTSTFDGDTVLTLEGVIKENNWTNPHSFIVLEVRQPDGSVLQAQLEADGPSLLRPLGATAQSLAAGDRVVVYASPSRQRDEHEYLAREAIKEDGTVVPLSTRYARERAAAAPRSASGVIGTWVPDRGALFEFVPWRGTWDLTAAGEAGMAAYDIRAANFGQAQCVPATAPTLMVYPTAKVIEDRGDHLFLNADWMGATRTIWMDGRDHPPADQVFLQGHSTGRWEGETLVIDTANFSDNPIGNAFGVPSGSGKRIVERLSLSEDRSSLRYGFELEDPEFLAAPVSNAFVWHFRPDIEASTVACDLDAASRYLNE